MGIKDLFKKETNQPEPEAVETVVCPACKKELIKSTVVKKKYVCYECGHYFRVRAKNRIKMVADAGSFEAWGEELTTGNPLNFPEYEDKVAQTQEKTGLMEGVTIGKCTIYGEQTFRCFGIHFTKCIFCSKFQIKLNLDSFLFR